MASLDSSVCPSTCLLRPYQATTWWWSALEVLFVCWLQMLFFYCAYVFHSHIHLIASWQHAIMWLDYHHHVFIVCWKAEAGDLDINDAAREVLVTPLGRMSDVFTAVQWSGRSAWRQSWRCSASTTTEVLCRSYQSLIISIKHSSRGTK